jgi:hypothetical protein
MPLIVGGPADVNARRMLFQVDVELAAPARRGPFRTRLAMAPQKATRRLALVTYSCAMAACA